MKSINNGVARKKTFWFFTSDRVCVFKSHHRISVPKTSKKACIKVSKQLYWFSQCSRNSHSCVQIKSSDYCDGVFAKLKYLNSYDYIFNPVFFIISLEGSHFGSRENLHVWQENSQTSKEIGVKYLNIYRLLCFLLTHSKAIIHFCCSFKFQPSFFVWVFSKTLIVHCVIFLHAVMTNYVKPAGDIKNGISRL